MKSCLFFSSNIKSISIKTFLKLNTRGHEIISVFFEIDHIYFEIGNIILMKFINRAPGIRISVINLIIVKNL